MKITENMVLFWEGDEIPCQWYPSNFVVAGIEYNCAEQYMMAQKAIIFGDEDTLEEIMDTDDPSEQKRLGRIVQNFDEDQWNEVALDIVVEGNYAKFSQNPELREWLLSTGDKILVEASPYDRIWGVGLRESDPRILDKEQWRGTNWLGEALSIVRDMLSSGESDEELPSRD